MKKLFAACFLLLSATIQAQVLEVPTLKLRGVTDKATKMEISQYDFVKDKGLTLTQSDIETYDANGRLSTIDRIVQSTGLKYRYTYKLSKKGVLQEEKIVNAANNETVRTTTYAYKKGLLVSTTQVQGTVTFIKNYAYDKNGHLIKMEAIENGSAKGEEIYQVDEEGRRTRKSQKLPTEEVARTISVFTYVTEGNFEIKTETRNVNGVKYEIVGTKDLRTKRNLKETTKKLGNSESGFNDFLFGDDDRGSWIKGEIVDSGYGRSRLVLRKITYVDGTETGRVEMLPEDDRAQYYRQSGKFQVLINGKIADTGGALAIPSSDDRLTYHQPSTSWILLKGYEKESHQTTWHEGKMITNTEGEVLWAKGANGIMVYQNGKSLSSTKVSRSGAYNEYAIADTRVLYFKKDLKKTLVVKGVGKRDDLGKVQVAEFTDEHRYWAKSSDSTYTLVSHGNYINVKSQTEDKKGNILVKSNTSDWYSLAGFREKFDNGKPGDIFSISFLSEPLKQIEEEALFEADFSSFKHDNFKKGQYNLKTNDGLVVSGLASSTVKTSDDQLITYFPLTRQYLKMDGYYAASDDKDLLDQSVSVLLDGFSDGYYIYNNGANINFYQQGVASRRYRFEAHKLDENAKRYGAVLYDSVRNATYGMNYDLALGDAMGPMRKLPINQYNVYLLKLQNGRWILFNRGGKIAGYDYTAVDGNNAVFFFKDHGEKIGAYRFEGYSEAKTGDFIASHYVTGKEAIQLSERLKLNPFKPIEDQEEKGAPNTFKREGESYWLWDENGEAIVNYLQSYGNMGSNDLLTHDTTRNITYLLKGYYAQENVEGIASMAISPNDDAVLKWGKGNVVFFLRGELQTDVRRVYINNSQGAETWSELVYDLSTAKTYKMSYPSKDGFYLGEGEVLPTGDEAVVLTKLQGEKFSIVREGNLDKNTSFKSDIFEGDLIYWTEGADTVRYRFKGFENGEAYNLFFPEVLTSNQLDEIKAKAK